MTQPTSQSGPGSERALYELDPTGRFSNRAELYRRHRPSYPPVAIDAILEGLGAPGSLTAADIGAGTGISARLMAERGVRVLALEPNDAMRSEADPHERIEYRAATAEATGLAAESVDLVIVAQAFHWFRPVESLREFRRILRPTGRLAIMWNQRDSTDALTAVYSDLIGRAADRSPEESWHLRPEELAASGAFSPAWVQTFRYEQPLDADGLVGRTLSASYVPTSGPAHEALVKGLRDAAAEFAAPDGQVRLVYRTVLYLAEPLSHPSR